MSDNPEICICFHVPMSKLRNFHHRRRPKLPSGFAHCHGAGTGCGWCVPQLEHIHRQLEAGEEPRLAMSEDEYVERRHEYNRELSSRRTSAPHASEPVTWDPEDLLDEMPDDLKLD